MAHEVQLKGPRSSADDQENVGIPNRHFIQLLCMACEKSCRERLACNSGGIMLSRLPSFTTAGSSSLLLRHLLISLTEDNLYLKTKF